MKIKFGDFEIDDIEIDANTLWVLIQLALNVIKIFGTVPEEVKEEIKQRARESRREDVEALLALINEEEK